MEIAHDDHPWRPWTPKETARRLAGLAAPWAIAGGWALELFAGERWREHEDLEVAVPAARFDELRAPLAGLELWVPVGGGRLRPLGDAPAPGQTWALDRDAGAWRLDVLREPSEGATWIYRRDAGIRMPYAALLERTAGGIPFVRPDVALLFKASRTGDKDELDFERVAPLLGDERRRWLREALVRTHPGHAWIRQLG
jgi:hypothetical protein